MTKLWLGVLCMAATSVFAQTTPKTTQSTTTKPAASSAAMAKTSKPVSNKPIPKPPIQDKLESGDNAIPSYKLEKEHGIHKGKGAFAPRRTASGARKDT